MEKRNICYLAAIVILCIVTAAAYTQSNYVPPQGGPQPTYGFMNWFLNTDRKLYPAAPASAIAHLGNGTNIVYIDPDNDIVIVARWIENGKITEFIGKVLTGLMK